jgi:hypothetical protein
MDVNWRKAARSDANGGACVEIARIARQGIAARDSKNPTGPRLQFDRATFAQLLDGIKRGKHDI